MGHAWRENIEEREISVGSIYAFKKFAITLVLNTEKGNYKFGAYEECLRSIVIPRIFWNPGKPVLEAECFTSVRSQKCIESPQIDCSCGIYSMKAPYTWGTTSHMITLVELSGKVVEGTLGYRSQRATLKAILWNTHWRGQSGNIAKAHRYKRSREIAQGLSSLYDIPILWHWDETATAEELINVSGRAHSAS